jgi:YD repeat-containing protein
MNQPTGLFSYTYDGAGRITNLVNPEGQVTSWVYDKASRVLATQMANGTLASNTYDNANQVLLLANLTTSGTTLSSFNYTYNPVGNRTQVVEANGDVLTLAYPWGLLGVSFKFVLGVRPSFILGVRPSFEFVQT